MQDYIPVDLIKAIWGSIGVFFLAWLGRLAWHVQQVQMGKRRFFSVHLLWELITALCIGFVAEGIASHLGLTGSPATAAIIVVAYLGPRGVESILVKVIDRQVPTKK